MGNFKMEEAVAVLDLIDTCNAVGREQLPRIFPDSNCEKIISYLLKRKRVHLSKDGTYLHSTHIGKGDMPRPDKALIAALNVLGDIRGKVQTYTKAIQPAQVAFISTSGDYYEICYVTYGLEAIVASMFGNSGEAKRIVIIEDMGQAEKIKGKIPGLMRFARIIPEGGFEYANP